MDGPILLQDKTAVIYGGGGSIGGAVARAFAREGASVFLAGRTASTLQKVAEDVRAAGGRAETAQVDALDEQAVDAFVDSVAERTGRIDITFNVIDVRDVRHMVGRGGVILMFGGGGPQTEPGLGGFKVALDAMEGMRRQWACEVGHHGIRVVSLVTGGVPESIPDSFEAKEELAETLREATLLERTATLADVGNVAAFVASDHARTMTSATVNISCGAIVDH